MNNRFIDLLNKPQINNRFIYRFVKRTTNKVPLMFGRLETSPFEIIFIVYLHYPPVGFLLRAAS